MEGNIKKEKINFWDKLIGSVEGIKHYQYILKETGGKAIIYLLLMSLLVGAIASIRSSVDVNNEISKFIQVYNNKCPNFEIKNGELSVEGNMPMVLSRDNNNYVVVDTTNQTNPDVLDSYNQGILILKDKIIQKKNGAQTQVTNFKSLNGMTIDKKLINEYLPFIKIVIPFIFIGRMLWYFIGGLLSSLFLALFALIVNGGFKTNLTYGKLYSISIYALTTPFIIDMIFKIFNINHFSYYWLVYHIIAFAYICFALYRARSSSNQ